MDNKKFEKLIDLIINEQEDQARELFHDIVVEKSREIYESMMDEEMMGEEPEQGGIGGQVGDMLDEINVEEVGGVTEDDMDDMDDMDDLGDEVVDLDHAEVDAGEEASEEIEDAVIRIEDKLDQLMAEFEELMGSEEGPEEEGGEDLADMGSEEDAGDEEMMGDEGGEEEVVGDEGDEEEVTEAKDDDDEEEDVTESEEEVMENVQLKKIPGLYDSKIGGDDGQNSKSIALKDPKVKVAGVNPVKFSGDSESVPTSPKKPSNPYTKGETEVKGAGQFKNVPGQDAGKSSFKTKAPAAGQKDGKEVGAGGSVSQNTKSVLESKKATKKIVK